MKTETVNPIIEKIEHSGLLPATGQSLKEQFQPFYEQAEKWKQKAESLIVTSPEQTKEIAQAKEARLAIRDIRISVEKKRKELKEDSLRTGQAIDGVANVIKSFIEPIETHLETQERFVAIQEEKRKDELQNIRSTELSSLGVDIAFLDLKNMPDFSYNNLVESSKALVEKRISEEKKATEERLAKEKSEAEEREKMRVENERLKQEAELREKEIQTERERLEAERKVQADKERKEREAIEAKAKKERDAAEAKLKAEREENARLERELKAKREAEEKVKRDAEKKIADEIRAKQLAEKKAKAAPDKAKLNDFATIIDGLSLPELNSEDAKIILEGVMGLLFKTSTFIREKAKLL